MSFNQDDVISSLNGKRLNLVDELICIGCSISSTESDINKRIDKAWTAIDRLSTLWKSDLTIKIKREVFKVVAGSVLLCGCTTSTFIKHLEKRQNGNCTRMLLTALNKFWEQHSRKQALDDYLTPVYISQVSWNSYVLEWTPTPGHTNVGWLAKIYF